MPFPIEPAVVRHPELDGVMLALDPTIDYPASDIIVKTYPTLFGGSRQAPTGEVVESVSIEAATAAPGEKRTRSKAK